MGRTVSSLLFWKWKWKLLSCVWLFATPRTIQPWNSPGQDTGVDNLSLLQGILPTQGSNPGLPHCRWILYQLSHTWHQTMVEVMKIMVTSFKKSHACTAALMPRPCSRPPPTRASARDSWTLTSKSRSVCCEVSTPFSWVLVHTSFVWALQAFLVGVGFDSKQDFALLTILLGLLLWPYMWGIFCWWDPTLSCRRLFSSEL